MSEEQKHYCPKCKREVRTEHRIAELPYGDYEYDECSRCRYSINFERMKYLSILIVLIMLSGCVTQRRCNDKFPPVQSINVKDSVVIREEIRYRDSIINVVVPIPKTVVRDSVVIVYKDGKDPQGKLYLNGKFSKAVVWIQNNMLRGELTESGWIPLQVKVIMQDKYIKELRSNKSDSVKVVAEYKTRKIVKVFAWIGAGFTFLLLLYIAALVSAKFTKLSIRPF